MKLLLTVAIVSLSSILHAANPQDCMKISNNLDRKYCSDKYLESIKIKFAAEKKTWANGINPADKANRTSEVEMGIQAKKDYAALITSEVAIEEEHLNQLKTVAEVAPAAPVKKKKHKGFRIKL